MTGKIAGKGLGQWQVARRGVTPGAGSSRIEPPPKLGHAPDGWGRATAPGRAEQSVAWPRGWGPGRRGWPTHPPGPKITGDGSRHNEWNPVAHAWG